MTSQNNSSSNNNNASWYIFGVKSRDKSSQAIYTLEYSIGGMALALGSHSMYSRVAEKKSRSSSESNIILQWFMSTLKGYFRAEIRKSSL